MTDARAAAWLTAWDCLVEADRCRKKAINHPDDNAYRDAMTDLLALSAGFAALINAPEAVGLVNGAELERRRDAQEGRERMKADMAEAFKKARDEEQP